MADYAPSAMELAPRDIVARSIQTEIDKGNGFENEYVHLDLRHLGQKKIDKRLPSVREICINFAGIDPVETPIPIQPAQHYSMGGIDVDKRCATLARRVLRGRGMRLRQRPRGQPPGREFAPGHDRLRQDRRRGGLEFRQRAGAR